MRVILAFRAFWAALVGKPLPLEVIPVGLLPAPAPELKPEEPAAPVPIEPVAPPPPPGPSPDAVAVQTLAVFQAEGRLLDFLLEDIESYSDEEIGAAVREVHRGCRRALSDHFKLVPVRGEAEESMITVPEGYDPAQIRLVGNVVGKPPFSGTLKHKGWRAAEVRLPQIQSGDGGLVVAPAEVEV